MLSFFRMGILRWERAGCIDGLRRRNKQRGKDDDSGEPMDRTLRRGLVQRTGQD